MATRNIAKRPGAPRDKVLAAVRELRELYAEGQKLRNRFAKAAKHGQTKTDLIAKEAEKRGTNADYLWKQFALTNPATGLSPEELDQICKCAIDNRRIVGVALMAKLLSVSRQHRMRFATMVLREGWSLSEVDAELICRRGRRRQGGRRPRLLASVDDLLVGVQGRCLAWSRLYRYLDAGQPGGRQIHWDDVPGDVQEGLRGVMRAIRRLQEVVAAHLEDSKTSRRSAQSGGR